MSFNYRVGKCKVSYKDSTALNEQTEIVYGIVECYYDKNGDIEFTSEEFQEPYGETLDELISDFNLMSKAYEEPILDLDELWKDLESNKDLESKNYK